MSMWPVSGIRPSVGLKPTTPQKAAGIRIEPPTSLPTSTGDSPAATAAADPPDEPPGVLVGSHGLFVRPNSSLTVWMSYSHEARLVFPTMIAPAARSRAATVPSRSGMRSPGTRTPMVDRSPFTA